MAALDSKQSLSDQIDLVKDIFLSFEKVLKGYRFYDAGHITLQQFQKDLLEKMNAFLRQHRSLVIDIKPLVFEFLGAPVYENPDKQENFSFRLFQDGVRQLKFRQGLTAAELTQFLNIIRTDFQSYEFTDDDISTLLWKADFKWIDHVIVETFVKEGEDSQKLEATLKQLTMLHLADSPPNSVAEALSQLGGGDDRKLRQEDVQEMMQLADIELGVSELDEDENAEEIRNELSGEHDVIIRRMILVLVRVLVGIEDEQEFESIAGVLRRLVHSMTHTKQFVMVSKILGKLAELARTQQGQSPTNATLLTTFYQKTSGVELLKSIQQAGTISSETEAKSLAQLLHYMDLICGEAIARYCIDTVPAALRQHFNSVLVRFGAAARAELEKEMASPDPEKAIWALEILVEFRGDNLPAVLKRATSHKDPRIRGKALDFLAHIQASNLSEICLSALGDSNRTIRMKALKVLSTVNDKKLAKPLYAWITSDNFDHLEREEKAQCYITLARLGGASLLPVFRDQLQKGNLSRNEKTLDRRLSAVRALREIGTPEAYEIVVEEKNRAFAPKPLKEICEQALRSWPRKGFDV